PADLVAQRAVEPADLERAAAQHGIAVLPHQLQRRLAAGAGLGIQVVGVVPLVLYAFLGHPARVYCGSTSTEKATSRYARSLAALSTASRTAAIAAVRS